MFQNVIIIIFYYWSSPVQGMTQFGLIITLALLLVVMGTKQKKMEVAMDEDEQTAQDYSIVVVSSRIVH